MVIQNKRICIGATKLINRNNICFFNSIIQCALSINELTDFYLKTEFKSSQKLSIDFKNFIIEYKEQKTVDPSNFIRALRSRCPALRTIFDGNEQDTHEFLTIFLDALSTDLDNKKNYVLDSKEKFDECKATNFLARIFFGLQQTKLTCFKCNEKAYKTEHFTILTIRIFNSIQDCISEYLKEEVLRDSNVWKCDKCGSMGGSSKKIDLLEYPNVLVIHLARFIDNRNKDTREVKIGDILKIENVQYRLSGMVYHSGTLKYGHYISESNRNGLWYHFDDTTVYKIDSESLKRKDAYVLFYTKI
ncbi:Ubiquitin carboxyl-terminal hydrolase 16 [Astathelohania contejeani]|uniref:Ubiquitin carboxyl-terminal hydrolase 16 n=1 Tax=Astathelohania contejeani TaxID=164912 RepID=A0ABQ7HZX0_9MICR|nr:Ubiquitin carboxyl-terminal hydrolase 16 [Thelohania contejeani]